MPTPREASIWGKIRNDLNQAQQSILNGQYSDALILNKRILKTLVRMQIDRAVLVSNNLDSDIDQLYENQLISSQTRDNYHVIRIYGEQAEAGDAPTSQAANESFSLIREELNTYMETYQTRPTAQSYTSQDTTYSDDQQYADTTIGSEYDAGISQQDLSGVNVPLSNTTSGNRGSSDGRRGSRPTRPLRDSERVSRNSGHRTSGSGLRSGRSGRNSGRRPKRRQGFDMDLYNVMKFLIPISCLILLIILIRIIMGGSSQSTIETTAASTETVIETTAAQETVVETTAAQETAAVSSVWVTTTGVKVRTEPNTNCEVLEVLDAGVQVTYKGEAGDEWIMIDYNGRDAYLNKQFVQEVASETQAAA
ncbi:SH3 domain-containing protein [Oribacterium sp. WCC10]|uniref:SH3 domain-containing protein n=1 Tax=Oribacterium sp. WCC10 TaxID=1855343 RepID=UPI0008E0425B|nr:SH3 domain-containing protein [Oribacterium sp. WCC10]SFG33557.1 SH3 domain-containing protein [Oribacterium sp. WCC10]